MSCNVFNSILLFLLPILIQQNPYLPHDQPEEDLWDWEYEQQDFTFHDSPDPCQETILNFLTQIESESEHELD